MRIVESIAAQVAGLHRLSARLAELDMQQPVLGEEQRLVGQALHPAQPVGVLRYHMLRQDEDAAGRLAGGQGIQRSLPQRGWKFLHAVRRVGVVAAPLLVGAYSLLHVGFLYLRRGGFPPFRTGTLQRAPYASRWLVSFSETST